MDLPVEVAFFLSYPYLKEPPFLSHRRYNGPFFVTFSFYGIGRKHIAIRKLIQSTILNTLSTTLHETLFSSSTLLLCYTFTALYQLSYTSVCYHELMA